MSGKKRCRISGSDGDDALNKVNAARQWKYECPTTYSAKIKRSPPLHT